MKIIIKNDLTGQTKTVIVEDKFKSLSADLQNETVNEISEQIDWSKEPQVQESQVKEETIYKPIKTVDDINLFYVFSPFYIPLLVLLIFVILIIKKKIKTGWSRIVACLNIMWTLFCSFSFLFLWNPVSAYLYTDTYNSRIGKIFVNLVFNFFICLIPFVLFFIIYMTVKWIREGFKEDKND